MKAITLWQPWASLVAGGVKTVETRSWRTSYRGPLAIHAAKRTAASDDMKRLGVGDPDGMMPYGQVVAVAVLVGCVPTSAILWVTAAELEGADWATGNDRAAIGWRQRAYGDFGPGRWAWLLAEVSRLAVPVAAAGRQQLWEWTT